MASEAKVKVLEQCSQSSDQNSSEKLWNGLKKLCIEDIKMIQYLEHFSKKERNQNGQDGMLCQAGIVLPKRLLVFFFLFPLFYLLIYFHFVYYYMKDRKRADIICLVYFQDNKPL